MYGASISARFTVLDFAIIYKALMSLDTTSSLTNVFLVQLTLDCPSVLTRKVFLSPYSPSRFFMSKSQPRSCYFFCHTL